MEGNLGGGIVIGGRQGLDTPPGAEKLDVVLSGVQVTGGFPALVQAEAAIRARLAGHKVTGADIFAAARELEAAYARAGYVFVRVGLPPQKLVRGAVLKLIVVDGMIERVETRNAPDAVRGRILALLNPLVGRRGLMLSDLERHVLLAGDIPGVLIRSTLAPGSTNGATVLVIEVKYQPVNGILSADNSLSKSLGRYQVGVGADFNSVFGFGELGYVRANGDPIGGTNGFVSDYARNRTLAAGLIVPLGVDGLSFNLEGTQARTTPIPIGGVQSTDIFERLSLRLRYAFVRSRDFNLSTQLVFDAQNERQSLLSAPGNPPLSLDRLRILRVTNDANYLTSWGGIVSASVNGSFGLDVLGARTAADATPILPLSRQGADATFTKLDGTLGYSQTLAEHLTADLSLRGQTSFGSALERAEQIGIAGPGSLSAFDTGELQGDSGVVLRGELGAPYILPKIIDQVGMLATPYAFLAGGEVFLSKPTVLEHGQIRAASYGGGLRLGGGKIGTLSNGTLTLEYGRTARSDGAPDENRFTFVSTIKF